MTTSVYEKSGETFYLHHDGKGGKYISEKVTKKHFIKSTKGGKPKFVPSFANSLSKYEEKISEFVRKWVDKETTNPVMEHSDVIGYVDGKPTKNIKIIYGGEGGAHIRPVS